MFKNSNAYKLNTSFSFHAPVETVWDEIITFENWPSWWVGLDRVENLHRSESVKGNMYKAVIKGYVPYGLSFYACVDEVVPLSMISTKVHGDLEGEGVCRFLEKNNSTRLSFDWNVKPTKLWMKILSPVAHSYFVRNHDKILGNGLKGLIKKLKIKQMATGAK